MHEDKRKKNFVFVTESLLFSRERIFAGGRHEEKRRSSEPPKSQFQVQKAESVPRDTDIIIVQHLDPAICPRWDLHCN